MRILISGLCGRMGNEVAKLAMNGYRGAELTAGVDINACGAEGIPCAQHFEDADTEVDCIVDFSHHTCVGGLLDFAVKNGIPAVIATTGHTDEERQAIEAAAKKIPVFYAANYSLGIALLIELAKKVAKTMPDAEIEIIEKHHDQKLDAPSGTALMLADAINEENDGAYHYVYDRSAVRQKRDPKEIGISSVRGGSIVGDHEVLFCGPDEVITLKHTAYSRSIFANGAINAAVYLAKKEPGLYNMGNMIAEM